MTEQTTAHASPRDAIKAAAGRADRLLLDAYDVRLRALAEAAEASLRMIAACLGNDGAGGGSVSDTWGGFWAVQAVERQVAVIHALTAEAILWGLAHEHAAAQGLWSLPGHEGAGPVRAMFEEVEARRAAIDAGDLA